MMARLNVLLILVLVIASAIIFNADVKARAIDLWEALQLVLAHIEEGLTVIIHKLTNTTSHVPLEEMQPPDDSPVFHTELDMLIFLPV
jgi:hypothetical protein